MKEEGGRHRDSDARSRPRPDSFSSFLLSLIGSAIAFCGAACVYFLVPDRKFTLEEEDEAFKAYLEENGWDTEGMMGLEKKVGA